MIREFELSWEETWGKVPTLDSQEYSMSVSGTGHERGLFFEVVSDFQTGRIMSVILSVEEQAFDEC